MKPQSYFVTGTDTGVGKTLVSCAILRGFAAKGLRVAGMKPVAAGCRRMGDRLVSEDVEMLLAAGNLPLSPEMINPYAFEPPVAPHIAAAKAGMRISLPTLLERFRDLHEQSDVVIVEGVGGFRVPLNDNEDTADLAVAMELPVILVVGMRLGCINHALLTAEAILQRGLVLEGWVANCIDPRMDAFEENLLALKAYLPGDCLGVIPYQPDPAVHALQAAMML